MSSSSTVLGPSTGYTDLLDEATTKWLTNEQESGRAFQKTPIRPSNAGRCSRALFQDLQMFHGLGSYPREIIKPNLHRLFALGHSIEWSLIKQFDLMRSTTNIRYKQQVLSFEYLEAKNNPKLSQWLEGSLDMVFWNEEHKCVADVKSKGDGWNFQKRCNRWEGDSQKLQTMASVEQIGPTSYWANDLDAFLAELDDKFFAANFKQLNLYANSSFLMERGVDHGAILQYRKNDSVLREVRFRPSRTVYEASIQKFRNMLQAVDENNPELAQCEYAPEGKCFYCGEGKAKPRITPAGPSGGNWKQA
jgi:hypothetical protein